MEDLYGKEINESRNPEASGENCTTNTGQVDREIEQLKEEKKVREQEKKLAQIESGLIQKDNDTYRRQNAVVHRYFFGSGMR